MLCAGFLPGLLPAGDLVAGKANAAPLLPAVQDRTHFSIRAGAAYRSIGDVKFSSGSRSGTVRLPFLATVTGKRDGSTGSLETYADRTYQDGFVRQDGGTELDGSTWNWGYREASQVSADGTGEGQSLNFHGQASSRSRDAQSRSDRDPGSWEVDGDGTVPVIQLDWTYDLKPGISSGLSLQYTFLTFDGQQDLNSFNAFQTRTSHAVGVTDIYHVGDLVIPQAPYASTYEGPGPLIDNRPSNRQFSEGRLIDRSAVQFYNQIEESLDVRLHQFTFGPTLSTRLGVVQVAVGAGLSLNIADWEAGHTETLYVKRDRQPARIYKQWSDEAGGTDVLPGVYLQLAATLPLTPRLTLTAYGNHDWSRTLSGQAGPSSFHIDPTGWTLGGMIGYSF